MKAILINIIQGIQTDKSTSTKLLNLTTHFSEIEKLIGRCQRGKKSDVAQCIFL